MSITERFLWFKKTSFALIIRIGYCTSVSHVLKLKPLSISIITGTNFVIICNGLGVELRVLRAVS